jgi:hypothetical protein
MSSQRRNELAEKAVQVLATSFVLLGGALASVFLIVSNSATPVNTLLAFSGGCVLTGIIMWLLREPDPLAPRAKTFSWWCRPKRETTHYKLKIRRTDSRDNDAPQQPPTAEQIREIASDGMNTWVPSPAKPRSRDNE